MSCLYKGKMSIVTAYIPSPHNFFLYFLEEQVHKDNKLGIMANVGKNRVVKVIFTNIHKISGHVQILLVETSSLGNV